MEAREYVQELIDRSRAAQQEFERYSQERVDEAVRAIGKKIYDCGLELAELAVEETGMGQVADKVVKNQGKSKATWWKLKGVKSRGVIRYIEDQGLVEVAKPIGVIGAVTPTTNPTMTPIHNAMVALKGGNSMIVCPHPKAKRTTTKTVEYMRDALREIHAPEDLIQVIPEPTMEISSLVMSMCDVCVSTGGAGMVHAAFSSGKPAFGVGAGNNQALIDRDVSMAEVAPKLIIGRTKDNGVPCTCEQSAICPTELYDELITEMKKRGVHYIEDEAQVDAIRHVIFPLGDGPINREVVGASPKDIAAVAGITVPEDTKMLLVHVSEIGKAEPLSREKLCPVQVAYRYNTWEEAVAIAKANLMNEGAGHSTVLHSNTKEHIEYAAEEIPVCRFMVNQIGSTNSAGAFDNGLNPTATLGCGSWGNNSISENLWWHHLVNICRISYVIPNAHIPTDDEIWGS